MSEWKRAYCPPEWRPRKLVDVIELPSGQVDPRRLPFCAMPLIAPDHVESGSGTVLAIQTAAEQGAISGKYLFDEDDVVYSKIRPYLRKAFLAGMAGLCSADMYPLRARLDELDPRFLLGVVLGEHFSRFAEIVSMRSGFPKINREELAEYIAALPPLPEQRAIAAVLDTIDDAIQKTELIIAKLQQVKQGLLHDLLTRGIDDNGELRDPERHPEQFQDSPLGRIPKGWRVARIGDIIESHQAGIYKDRSEYGEGSNIVGVADLFRHDSLDGQQFRLVRLTASEQSEFRLEAGDLVYAESSLVLDGIAKTLAVTEAGAGTTFAWHTRRLRPNRKSVRGAFLAFALGLPRTRAFVASRATQTALTGIPVAAYFETPVILPPVTEQDAISAMVMALEHQIKAEFAHSDKVKALKRGLAHDLLTGRVRTTSLPEFAA